MAGKAAADKAMTLGRVAGFDSAVRQERARLNAMFKDQGTPLKKLIQELKETMWFNAGIIRDRQSLDKALETIMGRKGAQALVATIGDLIRFLEFRNIRLMGEVVCRSALERTESRGSHFRSDYPGENDDVWLKNIRVRKTDSGLRLEQIPVPGGD
jgi:succinate dehydrogenase/fumarate reductase flavoprotein subunit